MIQGFMGLLLFALAPGPGDDFLVITSERTPVKTLSHRQLRQIWLKKLDRVDGTRVKPIQIAPAPLRENFEEWLFRKGFNATDYWLEQGLTGGEKPPTTVSNQGILMLYIARNPGLIGYISPEHKGELKKLGLVVIPVKDRAS